jgi:hypothetical protein
VARLLGGRVGSEGERNGWGIGRWLHARCAPRYLWLAGVGGCSPMLTPQAQRSECRSEGRRLGFQGRRFAQIGHQAPADPVRLVASSACAQEND